MKLILVGFGFIAKTLIKAICRKSNTLRKFDPDLKIVGVSNSKGYILDKNGLDLRRLSRGIDISDCSQRARYIKMGTALELVEISGADIMVETTPTCIDDGEPGLTFIKKALNSGMDVVTSNKGPLVVAFKELAILSKKNDCQLLYEGTVAGGIPVFSLVRECLKGENIKKISGILNGTTNYILTKMYFEETSFELALKEAQERGISEKDPSYDVDGIDAAAKVVILANALMKKNAKFNQVEKVGIRGITQEAVSLARKSRFAIKLIGTIGKNLEVIPKLVPISHPLCVNGTLNAIHFETDLVKDITLIGHGAGKETVSSVLNDILTILRKKVEIF